jgi:RND family efflux transporter MFP subunit
VDALLRVGLQNACWAAALALAAAVAARIWGRKPALAHALWLLVLLKLLAPSLVGLDLPGTQRQETKVFALRAPGRPEAESDAALVDARPETRPVARQDGPISPRKTPELPREVVHASAEPSASAGMKKKPLAWKDWSLTWKPAVALLWLLGVATCWSAVGLSNRRFRRLLDSAQPAPAASCAKLFHTAARLGLRDVPRAWIVPARIPPMLLAGMAGRPRLLLPEELWGRLNDQQKETVLAHELAHLKRRDHWVRRLETIALGLYWWFPIAWWARRELEEAEEKCCDAWVVWAMPDAADAYAESLVATAAFLSGHRLLLPAGATGAGRSLPIKRRLNMILHDRSSGPVVRAAPRGLLVLGALCLPFLPALTSSQRKATAAHAPAKPAPEPSASQAGAADAAPKAAAAPQGERAAEATGKPSGKPVKIRVVQAIERDLANYLVFSGRIEAAQSVQVRARVSGYLTNVFFAPGQKVHPGETLFQVDPRSYKAEEQKAEAELRRARARLKALSSQVALMRGHAVPQGQVIKAEGEAEEAEASVQVAQAALELARLHLEYTRGTAPIAGNISAPPLSPGNVVVADNTVLATITSLDRMTVVFYVTQDILLDLGRRKRAGMMKAGLEPDVPVQVGVWDAWEVPQQGKVRFVGTELEKNGTVRCSASVPNPDGLLLPGMRTSVRLMTSPPYKCLVVPAEVIGWYTGHPVVFVVTNQNLVEPRQVAGFTIGGRMYVVTGPVKAGEWVAIDSQEANSHAGEKVDPEQVPWPPPPAQGLQ